jgi:hypothetical protein
MAIPCVLIQWKNVADKDVTDSTKYIVLNKNYNPLSLPIQGLDPQLEVFVKNTPFARPVEDMRLVSIKEVESPVDEFDSVHTTTRKWVITYEVVERTNEDKKNSVDEVESDANFGVFPTKKQLKYLALYAVISRREARGLTISPVQQAILDKFEAKAQRIWINHIEGLNKKGAIDANQPLNLDENWETIDPEDEQL